MNRPCGDDCNRSTCGPTICHGRIPWADLPCREFCNAYTRGRCWPGRCGSPLKRDDPRYWLGRGQESVPGKPFGWARMMQDMALCDHQRARGIDPKSAEAYFARSRLHARLERDYHRRKPPIGVRRVIAAASSKPPEFTDEELRHLTDLFSDANDPTSAAIAAKAALILANR